MNIFSTRKDLSDRIDALESTLAETEAALVEANTRADADAETVRTLTESVSARDAEIAQLKGDLAASAELLADAGKAQAAAEAQAAALPEKVNAEVASVLASAGIQPVESVEQEETDILAAFDSLNGPAKTTFFRQHEAAIRAAMRG